MTTIEQRVMANVAVIYTVRRLVGRTALKSYALLLSVIGITFFVSVPHIAQNFEHVSQGGAGSIFTFIISAILGTTIVVQVGLLLGAAAFVSLATDFVKSVIPLHPYRPSSQTL